MKPPPSGPLTVIGAFQAKTELSRLLRATQAGKRFIITQRGKPVAELRPVAPSPVAGGRGDLAGKIWMADDFSAELEDFVDYMPASPEKPGA